MDLREYQRQAQTTDQVPPGVTGDAGAALVVPLLGLAGETGELLGEYKKQLRDGAAHRLFKERVAEELGDLLWYVANVASKYELDLDDVAQANLRKIHDRWQRQQTEGNLFDSEFPERERFPRRFEVHFTEVVVNSRVTMRAFVDGVPMGDDLTDNAYDPDGYRFHDVFHLALAAVLGWSPVTRTILRRKRKSNAIIDEVEDGGRAAAIEEGLSALVFDYARTHNFLEGITALDYDVLRTVKSITSHLEVSRRTVGDWENAILEGYNAWRQLVRSRGGRVVVDLDARALTYEGPIPGETSYRSGSDVEAEAGR